MSKDKGEKQLKRQDFITSLAFLSPSLIGVGVFFVIPFIVVVYYSLIDGVGTRNFVGLENFKNLFSNSAFILATKNTLKFSVVAVPLAVILSIALAVMLEERIPGKSYFRSFFLSPMMVPIASIILVWQVLFNYNGLINVIQNTHVDWLQSDHAQVVVVVLFLWKNLGYNMILFMAALNNIPRDLLEVADVEGASEIYKFFNIKLRYLSPTILFVTILSLINSFKVFREVYLLAGDYPYEALYMLQHFMNNTFKSLDYQKLSAAAVVMAIVLVVVIMILFKIEDMFGKDIEG